MLGPVLPVRDILCAVRLPAAVAVHAEPPVPLVMAVVFKVLPIVIAPVDVESPIRTAVVPVLFISTTPPEVVNVPVLVRPEVVTRR